MSDLERYNAMAQQAMNEARFWDNLQKIALLELLLLLPVIAIGLYLIHRQLAQLNIRDEFRRIQEDRRERNAENPFAKD